ncbi:MAG: hypothetical protein P8176_06910 [Gammaproteobacteria bacterium]
MKLISIVYASIVVCDVETNRNVRSKKSPDDAVPDNNKCAQELCGGLDGKQ